MSSMSRLKRMNSNYRLGTNASAKLRLEKKLREDMRDRGIRILKRILFRLDCQEEIVVATFGSEKAEEMLASDPLTIAQSIIEDRIVFYDEYMKDEFDRLFKRSQIRLRKSEEDN